MSTNNPFQIHPASSGLGTTALKVKDPVCGMEVTPANAAGSFEYQGQTYYFCAPICKRKFDEAPTKYVNRDSR